MDSFTELLTREHRGEFILVVLIILYLILGLKTPQLIANLIDNIVGKVVIILIVIYLFIHANPILAVLTALAAFYLMRNSSTFGISSLQQYAPSEQKKMSQFSVFNQFPYTLEQEIVSKMAPIVRSGSSLTKASYKPLLDNLYDAASLSSSN